MCSAGGMVAVHWPTFHLAGALPRSALPPGAEAGPGTGPAGAGPRAGLAGAGPRAGPPPHGKVAGLPPPLSLFAVCLVLATYNTILIYFLSI